MSTWATQDEYIAELDRLYLPTFDFLIRDIGNDGEFGNWATLDLIERGKVVETKTFHASDEFAPQMTSAYFGGNENDARAQAASEGHAWVEYMERNAEAERLGVHPLEITYAPYGPEWQREQAERYEEVGV